jgi:nicastrin
MTASTAANSGACIAAGNCKPLGAYSVWSALPPQAAPGSSDRKPIILVAAQMDSIDMFHDAVQVRSTVLEPTRALLALLALLSALLLALLLAPLWALALFWHVTITRSRR